MTANSEDSGKTWIDPDDAPEWTDEMFARADLYHGETLVRRGRPMGSGMKRQVTLRLDADLIDAYKATGRGWQTRINEALRSSLPKSV